MVIRFFIVLLFLSSCCAYKVADTAKFYSPEDIQAFVEEQHFVTNSTIKIPAKILRALTTEGIILTTDTALHTNTPYSSLLFCYGENKTKKRGYLLMETKNYLAYKNVCLLFAIKNKKHIFFSFYNLPYKITDWNSVKQFLVPDNGLLRIGGKIKK